MKRAFPLAILALAALVACSGGTGDHADAEHDDRAEAAGLSDEDRAANQALSDAFQDAVNAGDWAAVGALYTEDGILMPPHGPEVMGREAIAAWFAAFPPFEDLVLNVQEIEGEGDTAWIRGVYTMTIMPPGADPIADEGKFLEIRTRGADGSWLMARDLFNSDLAPAAE